MESTQGNFKVLLVLFKQRNGNTAKTEEAGWSQKADLELAEHSVVSAGSLKVRWCQEHLEVSKHPMEQTCTSACCQ